MIAERLNKVNESVSELILAKGKENNTHLMVGLFKVLTQNDNNVVVSVKSSEVSHPQHKPLEFNDSNVVICKQIEYDPFDNIIRKIVD